MSFRILMALAVAMTSLVGSGMLGQSTAASQSGRGLIDDTSYESPQFGYTVEWDEPWSAQPRNITSNPGGFDAITLRGMNSTVRLMGRDHEYGADQFLTDQVDLELLNAANGELVDEELSADVPSAEIVDGQFRLLLMVYTLEEHDAIVLVTLRSRDSVYEDALTSAQEVVLLNGIPVLGDGAPDEVATPEPTEVPTEEPPPPDDVTPTPEPTVEPTEVPTEEATPPETATPTPDEIDEGGVVDNTYTSPAYGVNFEWDDDLWEVSSVASEPEFERVSLVSTLPSSVTVWMFHAYDGNALSCVEEEAALYASDDGVENFELATGVDGQDLSGGDAGFAYAVYTLDYTPEVGVTIPLVDYFECYRLSNTAVVSVVTSVERSLFNDAIDDTRELTDTLVFGDGTTPDDSDDPEPELPATPDDPATPEPEAPATPDVPVEATPEPEATPATPEPDAGATPETFTVYTSPTFGYALTVPEGWSSAGSESIDGEDFLYLTNGTSEVTLRGTDVYSGDLEGCVQFAADELREQEEFEGLRLATTATGEPFSGADSRAAYGHYVYTSADEEERSQFIECRYLADGESVLILSQDVAYEQYVAERQARRHIQNSITIDP